MNIWPVLFSIYKWLSYALAVPTFGYFVWKYVQSVKYRPHLNKTDIVFQEWTASGCSQKNFITKMGGGRNCVRIVITKEILWVTSWFPFSLFAPFYDMEHVIPLSSITSICRSTRFWCNSLLLSYKDVNGCDHTLRLIPKRPDDFLKSLGQIASSMTEESTK
ncbi:MAG: hypothetical protein WCD79_12530 [Chthoniobacteraceae bacterium]